MSQVYEGVSADPDVMHGKPVIEGTRVPVEVVMNTLGEGVPVEEVCEEFNLKREQVLDAINYAADRISGEEYRAIEA
ncbi:MAG: DUF433 domain-containing protein [Candidatus Nanohaloarchaea archaeon]